MATARSSTSSQGLYESVSFANSASPLKLATLSYNHPCNTLDASTHPSPSSATVVDFNEASSEDPQAWSKKKKWLVTISLALQTFVASFASAAYTGGLRAILVEFRTTQEVVALVSLCLSSYRV